MRGRDRGGEERERGNRELWAPVPTPARKRDLRLIQKSISRNLGEEGFKYLCVYVVFMLLCFC